MAKVTAWLVAFYALEILVPVIDIFGLPLPRYVSSFSFSACFILAALGILIPLAKQKGISALRPLLDCHTQYYEIVKAIHEQRQRHIERQIQGAKQMIEALHKPPVSGLSEAAIIEQQMKIESLLNQISVDRIVGARVSQTQINAQGVSVVDRKPGFWVWGTVIILALFAGLFAAVFAMSLKHLELAAPRDNA